MIPAVLLALGAAAVDHRCVDVSVEQASTGDYFAAPTEALVISESASGSMTMIDLLDEFSRVTGQNIVMSDAAQTSLGQTRVGLLGGVTIPTEQVYSFTESLLARHRFAVSELRHTSPPLLAIYADQEVGIARWVKVSSEEIQTYADHHALLVQTSLDVSPLDSRALVNSMRSLFRGPAEGAFSFSSGTIVLKGTGSRVAGLASMIDQAVSNAEQAVADAEKRAGD